MRYLVKRIPSTSLVHYAGDVYYCEIAGGSDETKPTTGIITGSKFLETDTGIWKVFDEEAGTWTETKEGVTADPEVVAQAVSDWLDEHPEATTTVQDGSITEAKLATALATKVNTVSSLSEEIAVINGQVENIGTELNYVFPNWEQGAINVNNGEELASTARIRTGYIPLNGATKAIIACASTTEVKVVSYTSTQAYKTATEYSSGQSVHSVQDVAYIRLLARHANDSIISPSEPISLQLNNGNLLSYLFDNWHISAESSLQNVHGVTKFPGNLVIPGECTDRCYVNSGSGPLTTASGYFATGYIPVTAGTTYRSNVGRNLAWYDSNKTYISGVSGVGIQSGVTAPTNAAYIRFSINKSSDGISSPLDLYFTDTNTYSSVVTIDGLITSDYFNSKKIAWFGDSIVASTTFDNLTASSLGMTEYSYGVNGATFADVSGRTQLHTEWDTFLADNITPDVIAISAGTNDFQYSVSEVGSLDLLKSGTYDTSTFYGAIASFLDTAIAAFPTALIFATTPIKRAQPFSGDTETNPFSTNENGLTLMEYCDIIKEVCGYYSIPVCDLNRECGLNPQIDAQQYMFDSVLTHPTSAGATLIARRLIGWLKQLAG